MKRYLPFLIIAVVLVGVIVGAAISFRSKRTGSTDQLMIAPSPVTAPSADSNPSLTSTESRPRSNVSVSVEEFGDYQCPPCGALYPELKKIEQDYGSQITFSFNNLPLTTMHKNALVAAKAAEAARLQGSFWQMHDLLYEHQSSWKDEADPRPIFNSYARDLHLDVPRFTNDMESAPVIERIVADTRRAAAEQIVGTPTVLIEGKQLKPELTSSEGIRKGIDWMLKQKAAMR